jgi:hypothetical protein
MAPTKANGLLNGYRAFVLATRVNKSQAALNFSLDITQRHGQSLS